MIIQRPSTRHIHYGGGVEVRTGGGAVAVDPWWDPNEVGLSVVGAYRAINSIGTPWAGGPTNYAASLVNQANPGVNDLVFGGPPVPGAVPWVQATGWGFVAAALQYFDTGLVPQSGWSAFVQYANVVGLDSWLFGGFSGGNTRFYIMPSLTAVVVRYGQGSFRQIAPNLLAGNVGIVNQQGYRNGVADGGAIAAWGAPGLANCYIGAGHRQDLGIPLHFITSDIESVAVYNANAAAVQGQAAAIVAAMNQL